MSVQEHNPFKVGDKVKVKAGVLRTYPRAFKNFLPVQYAVVTKVEYNSIFTDVEDTPTRFEHFELYKEEKDMTQQTQQKTKRVPFTHELWEKWKDRGGKVTTMFGSVLEQFTYFNLPDNRIYAGVCNGLVGNYFSHHLWLEISVTTKRIPFNPELRDAKVFHLSEDVENGGKEVKDWWITKDRQLVCQWSNGTVGYANPHSLEMEIEED